MKYSDIIKANNNLSNNLGGPQYKIAILSNIIVHQSKEICEYFLRMESVNAEVFLGDYDNIVQDSLKIQNVNAVLIFWEVYNFIDDFHYKINTISDNDFQNIIKKIKSEINIVFNNLKNVPLVIINEFSTVIFEQFSLSKNRADQITKDLNAYLIDKVGTNTRIINTNKIISKLSIDDSIDLRYFYSSKSLYSINFYKKYFQFIKPFFLAATGRIKKALVLDCDNTLWNGILGEDGIENIKIYKEIQYLILDLSKQGVVICLCSKNNAKDIDDVLKNHPDMILKEKDITIKKVNWNDKVSNLKAIAVDLNIGTDSLVFIDDSSFEINLIKKELPEVAVFQVPNKEYEYGMMMRELCNLFYNPSKTREDIQKTKIYKEQLQRIKSKKSHENIEDYLKSLGMVLTMHIDDKMQVQRISQMTQKTNQFNLTTKRYTENDIAIMIDNKFYTVISISVSDNYGNNGITGLAILDNVKSEIDSLLLSCRILGRNIEYKFMDIIFDVAKKNKLIELNSSFIKSNKNHQVTDFYERVGFKKINETIIGSKYNLQIQNYRYQNIPYIKIDNGK